MNIREAFKKVRQSHGVTDVALHEHTGVSRTHLSRFQCGRGDLKVETLERLLMGLEELSPGAINDFVSQIGKVEVHGLTDREKQILIWSLPESELAEILRLIGERLAGKSRTSTDDKVLTRR
ncbi:helix-turn-helix domain-containing protein [Baaleninema sp.]|uniref:helix-turn-helix domain-containing protein n=1 Tax=Baaleninema sp. TaxID=3101197 RepID=UPI003D08973B